VSHSLEAALKQASSVQELDHRPWPLPRGPWRVGQTWNGLLFLHWRLPASALEPFVPRGVRIDTFDGSAWIGVIPLRLSDLRLRGLPPLPGVSSFLGLAVRTYVTVDEKPGIWFLSLDVESRLAAAAARTTYRLPCFHARMESRGDGDSTGYECTRIGEAARTFSGRYRAAGAVLGSKPASLEHFLSERYCLYASGSGRLWRAEVHHRPLALQQAEVEVELNTIAPVGLPGEPTLCHFAPRQDVLVWPLEPVTP
jgi:uncharacterized protein YqjF (DUF2071 family)